MPIVTPSFSQSLPAGSRLSRGVARLRAHAAQRRLQFQLASLAAVVVAGAGFAASGWMLASAQLRLSQTRAQLAQSRVDAEVQAQRLERMAAQREFVSSMLQKGLSQSQWSERKLNVKQVTMGRDAAQAVLRELARSRVSVFIADQFDVAVSNKDQDLFTAPASGSSEVVLTVRGQLFSKEVER